MMRFVRLAAMASLLWRLPNLGRAVEMEVLPPGVRPVPYGVHALKGATVVVKPGEVVSNAIIVIRDGYIENVGANISVPPDARMWDLKGLTVYAGFIDPCFTPNTKKGSQTAKAQEGALTGGTRFLGVNPQERPMIMEGPGYEVARVTPERRMVRSYTPDPKTIESMRQLGFAVANVTPNEGVFRGSSALVALSDDDAGQAVLKPDVFQHLAFDVEGGKPGVYPESLMGVIAVTRQTFFDAQHYALDYADYVRHPRGRSRPAFNPALEALQPVMERKEMVMFDPGDALMVGRAATVAREVSVEGCMLACGQEWRRPELAMAAGMPFIVPLNFPELPKLPEDSDWDQITLDELRAWDWAPENPAVLRQAGVTIALTTHGLSDRKEFRKNLRLALDRGLSESDALAALTTVPARLCGMEPSLGTVEAGKLADLTVVDGKGYFDPEAKIRAVWVDGRFYRVPGEEASEPQAGDKEKSRESDGDQTKIEEAESKSEKTTGAKPEIRAKTEAAGAENASKDKLDKEKKLAQQRQMQKRVARSPLEGRGPLATPPAVLIRDTTVWTCGPAGKLQHTDVLVLGGRIEAVGTNLGVSRNLPMDTLVIDGAHFQVTPGLIDCHSHSDILGDVNEATLPSTAMVRIGDVVNSETPNIYTELAGGLTVANLLHGSANPIGGQNCVIKLRDGELPEKLKFAGALPGIKFALGENVKQSNWGDDSVTRFPQTRMGVQTMLANRFIAAQQYLKAWADYKKSGGVPPRRDLELEAIGEIIQGQRIIHCHSYRQDEMLMLMRLMDQFNVRVGTLQHVLEGYKIADEIAKHGAGGSTFSDWWGYKYEVLDAIPYNGSLMRERGVLVSFNSDSHDLARRLNTEAAKAVKYGGTPEEEALKFVTLNPARQLRIDNRVGSLEPGKDADFVIWSGSPLDTRTVCLQTWIDGKKYFDRAQEPARADALAQERSALLAKAKKLSKMGEGKEEGGADDHNSFFKLSLEHRYDGIERHCLGERADD